MALERAAAWRAWRSFAGASPGTQLFLLGRMAVAPLGPLEPDFKHLSGRVLSLGCGYGVVDRYVAEINPAVQIEGIELDRTRVDLAAKTEDRAPRVRVRYGDVTLLEEPSGYDAALAIDVFHHIPFDQHERIAAALHRCLRPGAVCLVKEMGRTPRRQYLWNRLHDRLSTGERVIYCRDPEEIAEIFIGAGFRVDDSRRVPRLRLYPQYLVRLTRE